MGNDREKYFREDGMGIPLLEGKSIDQYEVIPLDQVRIHVPDRRQVEPGGQYRIACADCSRNLATPVACYAPFFPMIMQRVTL